jgi:hypothetical protein
MEMRFRFFRGNSPVLLALVVLIMSLIIVNGCLYKSNRTYRQENRNLIIQNDSVLSINIELNEQLNNYKRAAFKDRKRG